MKAMGKRSLSRFLTVLSSVAWIVVAVLLAVTVFAGALNLAVGLHPAGGGSPSVKVYDPGVRMVIPVSFRLDSAMRVTSPSLGIQGAQIKDVHGSLTFPLVRGPLFFTNWVLVIGLLSATLWVLAQLRALFRTLAGGQPFVPANACRIRRIGWAMIVAELARMAIVSFEGYYAMTYFRAEGFHFAAQTELDFFVIVNGLILLVIAEVFRTGTRLEQLATGEVGSIC